MRVLDPSMCQQSTQQIEIAASHHATGCADQAAYSRAGRLSAVAPAAASESVREKHGRHLPAANVLVERVQRTKLPYPMGCVRLGPV